MNEGWYITFSRSHTDDSSRDNLLKFSLILRIKKGKIKGGGLELSMSKLLVTPVMVSYLEKKKGKLISKIVKKYKRKIEENLPRVEYRLQEMKNYVKDLYADSNLSKLLPDEIKKMNPEEKYKWTKRLLATFASLDEEDLRNLFSEILDESAKFSSVQSYIKDRMIVVYSFARLISFRDFLKSEKDFKELFDSFIKNPDEVGVEISGPLFLYGKYLYKLIPPSLGERKERKVARTLREIQNSVEGLDSFLLKLFLSLIKKYL
ncbi:MAG: hypothetical protein J7L39_01725 [Candidatus Aenigmarchaeota archaeon]|nr:hypothetical protein [Candidatus Aenigmarchaeota archaeon]